MLSDIHYINDRMLSHIQQDRTYFAYLYGKMLAKILDKSYSLSQVKNDYDMLAMKHREENIGGLNSWSYFEGVFNAVRNHMEVTF